MVILCDIRQHYYYYYYYYYYYDCESDRNCNLNCD